MIENNPISLFKDWYEQAQKLNLVEPEAAVVATSDLTGTPSARVLLLKHYDERGFVFFTNLTSRKGRELRQNPKAAVCFYWDGIKRQVRIEGKTEIVSVKEADDYFNNRERGSQIGAWASKQSEFMEDEQALVERIQKISEQFAGGVIPRPPFWSGFCVVPEKIEFWQSGEHRLNTRILYSKNGSGWDIGRLYP